MTKLILASNSPRRRQFLTEHGYTFTVCPSDFDEKLKIDDPQVMAEEYSYQKAKDVYDKSKDKNIVVLGSDTVVFCGGEILGKAKDEQEAKNMLKFLSGKSHYVISGYCIYTLNKVYRGYDKTEVVFNNLTEKIINDYIGSGLYKGKAGSYGIQDNYPLIKKYNGSIHNVIGLPTEKIFPILDELIKSK